jgi:ketosteroid isomerase-like protein
MEKGLKPCLLLLNLLWLTMTGVSQSGDTAIVRRLMHQQELAWNKGDIEGFMDHYWNSDSLRFIGSKGITYGWEKTLDNYKKGYPTKDAMGILTFNINSIEKLSPTSIYVIGQWHLQKKDSEVGGYFTLLSKKKNGKWVIVADHTS